MYCCFLLPPVKPVASGQHGTQETVYWATFAWAMTFLAAKKWEVEDDVHYKIILYLQQLISCVWSMNHLPLENYLLSFIDLSSNWLDMNHCVTCYLKCLQRLGRMLWLTFCQAVDFLLYTCPGVLCWHSHWVLSKALIFLFSHLVFAKVPQQISSTAIVSSF